MKKIAFTLLVLSVLFSVVNSCSKQKKPEIVGKWLFYEESMGMENPDGYIEYFEDGTWKVEPHETVPRIRGAKEGTWTMVGDDLIRTQFTHSGKRFDRTSVIKHDGDDLIISNDDVPFYSRHVRIK